VPGNHLVSGPVGWPGCGSTIMIPNTSEGQYQFAFQDVVFEKKYSMPIQLEEGTFDSSASVSLLGASLYRLLFLLWQVNDQ